MPFWDEIEHAANDLAAYNDGIRRTSSNVPEYNRRARENSLSVPGLFLPHHQLSDARPAAQRMVIVRRAHKNYEFASIYQRKRTNQLLYTGFQNLDAAITSLDVTLSDALREFSASVSLSLENMLQVNLAQTEEVTAYHKKALQNSEQQAHMLDNIQRGNKPWP